MLWTELWILRNASQPSTYIWSLIANEGIMTKLPGQYFRANQSPWPNGTVLEWKSNQVVKLKVAWGSMRQWLPTQTATSNQLRRKLFNCLRENKTYSCTSSLFQSSANLPDIPLALVASLTFSLHFLFLQLICSIPLLLLTLD